MLVINKPKGIGYTKIYPARCKPLPASLERLIRKENMSTKELKIELKEKQFTARDAEVRPECDNKDYLRYTSVKKTLGVGNIIISYGYKLCVLQPSGSYKCVWVPRKIAELFSQALQAKEKEVVEIIKKDRPVFLKKDIISLITMEQALRIRKILRIEILEELGVDCTDLRSSLKKGKHEKSI